MRAKLEPRPVTLGGGLCRPLPGRGLVRDCAGGVHPAQVVLPRAHRARSPEEVEWTATACRSVREDGAVFREQSLLPSEPIAADVEVWRVTVIDRQGASRGDLRVEAPVPATERLVPSIYRVTPTELAAALAACGSW